MKSDFLISINRVLSTEGGYVNDQQRGTCIVDGCPRDALSKGMCNTHYLRSRKGKDLSSPISYRKRDAFCKTCNEPTKGKGGWGLCANHYKKRRNILIKETLVELLGGKCSCCGGKFPLAAYDFHHTGDKVQDPSTIIANGSVSDIAEEISKCVLLCANCHRVLHSCQ